MTSAAAAAEVLTRAGRPLAPPPATSPSAPPAFVTPVLEPQLAPRAEADRRWLQERLKVRFGGLEDLGPQIPRERWCVEIRVLAEKPVPWTGGRVEDRLVRHWFFGPDPGIALVKARAWVEQQRRRP